jgi:acyl carrier protein
MDEQAILGELRDLIVKRLKFDPKVVAGVTPDTALPKGVEGSLGLDSLDFIELSIALEERFGLVVQEGDGVEQHFATLGALARFVLISVRGGDLATPPLDPPTRGSREPDP